MSELRDHAEVLLSRIQEVILGKEQEVREVFLALAAGGNILLEDIPGVGKTTLALCLAKLIDLDYKRVQFTPDVMPSDLTGFSVYRPQDGTFVYQKGSLFCQLLLADEINRTLPKTQSALLEAMEEKKVTVEGVTRTLPTPFFVIATQNVKNATGTMPLPESQMDRFIISESLGLPDYDSELQLAMETTEENRLARLDLTPCITAEEMLMIQKEAQQIFVQEDVARYLLDLITATRNDPYLERGAGPRATIALMRMARAAAWLKGREYVRPFDVAEQFPYVVRHRIAESRIAQMDHKNKDQIIQEILDKIKTPTIRRSAR
ncbi:MAG: MoxR family ATPase [Clostridiales bacterium]|nr:MoxR family ATPase [Clostridiales bacterium]